MGSFDRVKNLLNEVTYNPDKSIARDKARNVAFKKNTAAKMDTAMGFETPKPTEKKRSQLLKVGSKAFAKAKGKVADGTEILAILQSLKESYESGQISEAAFLKLAQPIIEKKGYFSAGALRNSPPGAPQKQDKDPKAGSDAPWGGKGPKQKKGLKKNSAKFPSKIKPEDRG